MSLPPRTQQPARAVPYSIPPPRLAYRTSPYPSSFPFPSTQQQQQQQQQQPATPTPSTLSTFSPAQAAPPLSTGMVAPPSTSTSYFRPGTIFPASFPPLTPPTAGVLPVSVSSNHFPAANYAYQSSQQLNSQLASPLSSMSALAHSILPSSALGLPQDSHHSTCSSSSAPTSPDLTEDRLSHKEFSPQTPNDGVSLQDPIHHFPSSSYTSPPHTMFPGPVYTPPEYHSAMTSNHPSCLPPMPLCNWNAVPYPPLGSLGVPPPPPSIPKLSYDSPRFKLTPERAIPLIKWFEEHKDHPYPTRHEKMLLCQSTQLTFTQVSTWFANARRRMKKANSDEERGTGSPEDSSSTGSNSPLSSEAAEPGKGLASDTEH